jgi:flagellar biosynthesis protein FlhA
MRIEPLQLDIGYGLMDLVDAARGGDLLDRVRALRRKTAMELGVVAPPVRTRDSMALGATSYEIRVHGVVVGAGEAPHGVSLLLGPCPSHIPGRSTTDPVFGMDASWIPVEFASQAEMSGATVIDRGSVITTHLAEVIRTNASRLLSRQDVKLLVDGVRASDPAVTEELAAVSISLAEVQRVLQSLLEEGVTIRDLIRILEVMSERGRVTKDPEALVEAVRTALGPAISVPLAEQGRLSVITLDPMTERLLLDGVRTGDSGSFLTGDASVLERVVTEVSNLVTEVENRGVRPVLVCSGAIRPSMRRLLRGAAPSTPVLAYSELGPQLIIETVGVINLNNYAHV